MHPEAVISGQRAQEEEQVRNVPPRSGMSVALDPWRLLVDEPLDREEETPPLSAAPIRKAYRGESRILQACMCLCRTDLEVGQILLFY